MTADVKDFARLLLRILEALDRDALSEERMPAGTELEWEFNGVKRKVYNDKEGNWYFKDNDKLARPARKRLTKKIGQRYPEVERISAGIRSAKDCFPDEFYVADKTGGKCVAGVELVRDIEMLVEGAVRHQDARSWYRDSKSAMDAVFGSDSQLMLALIAATSQNQALDRNIALAFDIYANHVKGTYPDGLSKTTKGILGLTPPKPGEKSTAILGIKNNVALALSGDFALSGPKIGEFAAAMYGDEMARTIDTHMFNLFFGRPRAGDKSYPTEYQDFAKKTVSDIAERLGWTPAETQAALWVFWLKDVQPVVEPEEVAKQAKKARTAQEKARERMARGEPAKSTYRDVFDTAALAGDKFTTYKDIFELLGSQIGNLVKHMNRRDWAQAMTALDSPQERMTDSFDPGRPPLSNKDGSDTSGTLWSHFRLLTEANMPKKRAVKTGKKKYTETQLEILNSLIDILKYQQKAYENAGKLVGEIERMKKSGELDKFIASVGK